MTAKPGADDLTKEAIAQDIEQARGELAETVDALVAKTDVKRRVGEKTDEVKANLADKAQETKAKVGDLAGEAKVKVDHLAGQASSQAEQAVRLVRRKPVPAAVVAAVIAALIALLVTRRAR